MQHLLHFVSIPDGMLRRSGGLYLFYRTLFPNGKCTDVACNVSSAKKENEYFFSELVHFFQPTPMVLIQSVGINSYFISKKVF